MSAMAVRVLAGTATSGAKWTFIAKSKLVRIDPG